MFSESVLSTIYGDVGKRFFEHKQPPPLRSSHLVSITDPVPSSRIMAILAYTALAKSELPASRRTMRLQTVRHLHLTGVGRGRRLPTRFELWSGIFLKCAQPVFFICGRAGRSPAAARPPT
jgi:hypothetical protein